VTEQPPAWTPSPDELERVRLLGDTQLYDDAVTFVRAYAADQERRPRWPSAAQLNGLLESRRHWGELDRFVKHQAGREAHGAKPFYEALRRYPPYDVRKRIVDDWRLVPAQANSGLSQRQHRERLDHFSTLLVRSFVEHLVAEVRYRAAVGVG
jgi:hypothetical protein